MSGTEGWVRAAAAQLVASASFPGDQVKEPQSTDLAVASCLH